MMLCAAYSGRPRKVGFYEIIHIFLNENILKILQINIPLFYINKFIYSAHNVEKSALAISSPHQR